jgi:hypothetical protein
MSHYAMDILRAVVVGTLFLSLSYAQDFFTPPPDRMSCPRVHIRGSLDPSARVNTTGQVAFTWDTLRSEEWYFSLTLNDTRSPTRNGQKESLQSYLSFPNSTTEARGVVFQFSGINASATGTGMNGCEGVLSTECFDKLNNVSFGGGNWNLIDHDELKSSCPWQMLSPSYMSARKFQSCSFDFVRIKVLV